LMASVTKNNGKAMAEDESNDRGEEDERDEREDRDEKDDRDERIKAPSREPEVSRDRAGFFTIYKSGQGYWTRMGTAGGAALILIATSVWLYQNLPVWSDYLRDHRSVLIGALVGFIAAFAILVHWTMNRPIAADFLIATDSEMKKVNWTTKADLIGSTKVVILFTLAVTLLLFVVDLLFGYLFYFLGVLKTRPF
jgi:preprotein translocase subunit SecE